MFSLTNHCAFCAVGPGGSPDENGETTIDALVMDGVPTVLVSPYNIWSSLAVVA